MFKKKAKTLDGILESFSVTITALEEFEASRRKEAAEFDYTAEALRSDAEVKEVLAEELRLESSKAKGVRDKLADLIGAFA